jgi:4'-phosphopantetheinyl transferase
VKGSGFIESKQRITVILGHNIHVWEVVLDLNRSQIEEFSGYLTAQERERAAKFINPIHADRWTVARGYLRQILSYYLDFTPSQIVFAYGAQGKPEIADRPIEFNLSHAREQAVYAISAKYPVGIDIEYIHPLAAAELVDRFFSPAERAIFHSLPVTMRQAAFFHAWTQKEAYLKACGSGLATPLNQIEVSIDPRTPAQIIVAPTTDRWQIHKLAVHPEYAGAIVIGGEFEAIEYQQR